MSTAVKVPTRPCSQRQARTPPPARNRARLARPMTVRDLLESGLPGLWKDRTDLGDTLTFCRKLRARAQSRPRE